MIYCLSNKVKSVCIISCGLLQIYYIIIVYGIVPQVSQPVSLKILREKR